MTEDEAKTELLAFLDERVFEPILTSQRAPSNIKSGVRLTRARMSALSPQSMIDFVHNAIAGTGRSEVMASRLLEYGLPTFEDHREEFDRRFNDEWVDRVDV